MADLERLPAHDHIHAVDAVHMGQVDQQEAVAADKALLYQGGLGAFMVWYWRYSPLVV